MQTYVPPSLPTTPTVGASLGRGLGHRRADRIAKGHMAHNPLAEKCRNAMKGAVDELVGHHKIGGLVLFLERSDGRDREDALDAQLLEGVNVGAEVQLRGKDAMAAPMPRKKSHLAALQLAQNKGLEGSPKGVSTCSSRTLVNPGME